MLIKIRATKNHITNGFLANESPKVYTTKVRVKGFPINCSEIERRILSLSWEIYRDGKLIANRRNSPHDV